MARLYHADIVACRNADQKFGLLTVDLPCCWPGFVRIIRRRRDILMHEQVESAFPLQTPRQSVTRHLRFNDQQILRVKRVAVGCLTIFQS